MGKTRAPYPAEFREEAVQLVRNSGKPVAEVARGLGVSYEALRHWIKQSAVDTGEREGLTTDDGSELTKLRRENLTLRQEREVLKNHPHAGTRAYLARESESG